MAVIGNVMKMSARKFLEWSRGTGGPGGDAYCPTCKRSNFHWGGCADQNALAHYPYGRHPIPYPKRR